MKRLTKKIFDNDDYYVDVFKITETNWCDEDGNNKESAYTGEAINKLADYENAEEQERIVISPCKVGDICYRAIRIGGKVDICEIEYKSIKDIIYDMGLGCFGKTIFLSKNEAERALYGECHGCKYGDDRFDNPCSCPIPCENHNQYKEND